jgi:hypothetical protein
MTGFHFEDSVSQRLLMRWRRLSYLAIGLAVLLVALLLAGLGLVDARQQLSRQLQVVLQARVYDYSERANLADQQLNLWQRKQNALARWVSAEQLSQLPFHTLLLAQQLANAVDGRVTKLTWSSEYIQLWIHSEAAWSVVDEGLQNLPPASLKSVRQINTDEADVSWYEYHVVIPYGR